MTSNAPSSEGYVLAHPTSAERARTFTATHSSWGTALTVDEYLAREDYLGTIPLSRGGGLEHWILTTPSASPSSAVSTSADAAAAGSDHGARPVLSTCETLRKRALVRGPGSDAAVRPVWAYGVASVFTYPESRGRGHALRMMSRLADALAARQQARPSGDANGRDDGVLSVLYSDIGRTYYGKAGWQPHESAHLAFPVPGSAATASPTSGADEEGDSRLGLLVESDFSNLASRDESLIRESLSRPGQDPSKTRVALLPDVDTYLWHMHRQDFMCKAIFGRVPEGARGVLYTSPQQPSRRVWAVWIRAFYGALANPEKNVMYVGRFVVEDDEGMSDEELAIALRLIVRASQREAREWHCARVEMWNPLDRVQRLVGEMPDLGGSYEHREEEGICSLNWLEEPKPDSIEWLANEKFAWC